MWQSMTEAQAIVLNGAMTILAGLLAVLLGGVLFSRQVRNIRQAHEETERLLQEHSRKVSELAGSVEGKLSDLDLILAGVSQKVSSIEGTVSDAESAPPTEIPNGGRNAAVGIPPDDQQQNLRERLKQQWHLIRDVFEQAANDPSLDGRTRASFMRIDRRNYLDLINKMQPHNLIPDMDTAREAVELWGRFRNGKRSPTLQDVEQMRRLWERLDVKTAPA